MAIDIALTVASSLFFAGIVLFGIVLTIYDIGESKKDRDSDSESIKRFFE